MTPRYVYILVAVLIAVPVLAAFNAIDMTDPGMIETIDDPVYVVVSPVAAATVPPPETLPPTPNSQGAPPADPVAVVTQSADRGIMLQVTPTVPPPVGFNGLPLAPAHLDGCDEAKFYRQQAGLIAHFDGVAWRESRCDKSARNWCCTGLWQIHRLWVDQLAHCGVWVRDDLYDPQRNACAAAYVYAEQGAQAWSTW